jgi:hypothetical protein
MVLLEVLLLAREHGPMVLVLLEVLLLAREHSPMVLVLLEVLLEVLLLPLCIPLLPRFLMLMLLCQHSPTDMATVLRQQDF